MDTGHSFRRSVWAVLAVVGVSLWFAFYERATSEKLKREQDKTHAALVDAQDQYHLSQRQAALLKINQALGRPMNRDFSQRMLYLAQSLETITKLPPEMGGRGDRRYWHGRRGGLLHAARAARGRDGHAHRR